MDAKIIEDVQNFIKNYVLTETKSKGVVLGLSGGKDSLEHSLGANENTWMERI